ncbi:carotenoid oxygenase (plasmid) [Paracoccus aminophilus JCM 7686]|uniref:Dioxygenase n=1 Tax=Paracoccus aminophilus JCM 7686 TaxID=1367847 RepID=S5YHQ8_PARAH|nr:carotenoid oxygenase family protein [Paracoccus aminophilus]AGT10998.1 carotenoid oxygenase [Paracoccus aminophilus JCM 7686]
MIHGLRTSGGQAEWYRNRRVDTPALTEGKAVLTDQGTIDLTASAAGTSVIAHTGRILALQEINPPFELTSELAALGAYDYDGALKAMMTALPRIFPRTGELLFFGSSPLAPHLTYHIADVQGRLVHGEFLNGSGPTSSTVGNRPPWSPSTASKPISRRRQ